MSLSKARKALSRVLDQGSRDCLDEHNQIVAFNGDGLLVDAATKQCSSSVGGPNHGTIYFFDDGSALRRSMDHGGMCWRLSNKAEVPHVFGIQADGIYMRHWLSIVRSQTDAEAITAKDVVKFWSKRPGYAAARFDEAGIERIIARHFPYLLPKEEVAEGVQ